MTNPERDAIGRIKRPRKYNNRVFTRLTDGMAARLSRMAEVTDTEPSTILRQAIEREVLEWEESGGGKRL